MRLAVIVAPMEPELGPNSESPRAFGHVCNADPADPATHSGRRAASEEWLGHALSDLGFEVVVVEGGAGDSASGLAEAIAFIGPTDTLLVHASGALGEGASIRLGRGDAINVAELAETIGARAPRAALVMIELTHDGDPDDALTATEHVEALRTALDARARGHAALVAVHAAERAPDALALTRRLVALAAEARREASAAAGEGLDGASAAALLSQVVDRFHDAPSRDSAACFALVRGATDFPLATRRARRSAAPSVPAFEEEDPPRLDALLELADAARDRASWEPALAGYQAAFQVARHDAGTRAAIHARIGALALLRGRAREARRAFEKALQASPEDRAALDALVTLATDAGDWRTVDELRSRRVAAHATHAEQAEELFAIAWTRIEKLGDVPRGIAALETARALDASRADVLEALRRAYLVLERWPDLLETIEALASHATTLAERAARRFSQARVAHKRLKNEPRAIAYLEAALEDDPTHAEALARLTALRVTRGERHALARTLVDLAARLDAAGEPARAEDVRARVAALAEPGETPPPEDRATAIPTGSEDGERVPAHDRGFEGPTARSPTPLLDVADAARPARGSFESLSDLAPAPAKTPLDPDVHARSYARHAAAGRWDAAYLAALALEELGATGAEHRDVLERHRPEGLAIKTPLDDLAWARLRAPGSDPVLESLFGAVSRAALAANVEDRRARRALVTLDPARLLPATSTASIARTFQWAARVVGVPCPRLYVIEDVPGDIKAVTAPEASTVLGPGVLSGRSTKELAFAAGRHLAYYRPEHAVLLAFPTLQELTLLVLASLQIALPEMPVPPPAVASVDALRARLVRHMTPEEHAAVVVAVRRIDARRGRVGLAAWSRSVELTATRAGLLLCGDLRSVMSAVRRGPPSASGLSLEDARADLLAFCTSTTFAELRAAFAVLPDERSPAKTSGSTPPPSGERSIAAPRRRDRETRVDVDPGE